MRQGVIESKGTTNKKLFDFTEKPVLLVSLPQARASVRAMFGTFGIRGSHCVLNPTLAVKVCELGRVDVTIGLPALDCSCIF